MNFETMPLVTSPLLGIESSERLMEHTTTLDIGTTDEAWKADREETKCASYDVLSLVDRVLDRWKSASIGYRAMAYAQLDRPKARIFAQSLREAERTLFDVLAAAFPLYKEGYGTRFEELAVALLRCRELIALPVAKRMAERDATGPSENEIAHLLAKKAQFIDGRAVINQALASKLPSPYATEVGNA